jgi:hypothetical protein
MIHAPVCSLPFAEHARKYSRTELDEVVSAGLQILNIRAGGYLRSIDVHTCNLDAIKGVKFIGVAGEIDYQANDGTMARAMHPRDLDGFTIPLEYGEDGRGSRVHTDARADYRVELRLASAVHVRIISRFWDSPPLHVNGRPVAQIPSYTGNVLQHRMLFFTAPDNWDADPAWLCAPGDILKRIWVFEQPASGGVIVATARVIQMVPEQ